MHKFIGLVIKADGSFNRPKSCLNNIVLLLGGDLMTARPIRNINRLTAVNIENEIIVLPTTKLIKYKAALEYLGTALDIDSFARPTNCTMTYDSLQVSATNYWVAGTEIVHDNGKYEFIHHFGMDSTNGDHNAVLSQHLMTREHVWYPRMRAYMPPFNNLLNNVPADFFQPRVGGSKRRVVADHHSTQKPALIVHWPLQIGRSINIRQRYQYKCPNREWKDIPQASFELEKGVRWGLRHTPVFYFSKRNYAPENPVPYHFEVEINIGSQVNEMPNVLPGRRGFPRRKQVFSDYPEIRVISAG